MNKKLLVGVILSLTSLSLVQAMEVTSGEMMKKDNVGAMMKESGTMMKDTGSMVKKDAGTMMDASLRDGMPNYDGVMMTSKKADIIKLQMMLVDKGYLIIPNGVSYGYYGSRTKMAHKNYKSQMMKSGGDSSMMKASGTIMNQ